MTSRRISNILTKEWRVMLYDLNSLLFVTLLPLLIIGQALLLIWLIERFGGDAVLTNTMFQIAVEKMAEALPAVARLAIGEQLQVFLLNQINFYLLLIPIMIAISFATFSIVDEKLSGSLEALLATPIRTWELLMGKALAGAVPALLVTWVCAVLFILGVIGLGWGHLVNLVLTPSWFISLFLLTPAVALLSFMLGVIGSSRAKDAKSAQNIVVVIILPVMVLIGLQVTGSIWFTPLLNLSLALGIAILDYFILRIAVRLFQRESIVVKWH
ncbi:ABC transporter permease subunit [Chloroflexota bacterium]